MLRQLDFILLAMTLSLNTSAASNQKGRRLEYEQAGDGSMKPYSKNIPDDRINFDGLDINITEAPWTVALARKSNLLPFCTGTIIEHNWILTAAHCTSKFRINPSDVVIVAGADRTKDFENESEAIQQKVAQRMVQHPDYRETTVGTYDVALIYVDELLYTNSVMPMTLWDQEWAHRGEVVECEAFGWGLLSNQFDDGGTKLRSVSLRKAEILAHHGDCNCIWKRSIQNRLLCSHEESVGGICQGDSGGPLICNNTLAGVAYAATDRDCRMFFGGIADIPCNSPKTMNMWMYVCPVLNFIKYHVPSAPDQPKSCKSAQLRASLGVFVFWLFVFLK